VDRFQMADQPVGHLMHVVSDRMGGRMDDGAQVRVRARLCRCDHEAWIIGDQAFVGIDFESGAVYAQAPGPAKFADSA
jgi:hypothetical protein